MTDPNGDTGELPEDAVEGASTADDETVALQENAAAASGDRQGGASAGAGTAGGGSQEDRVQAAHFDELRDQGDENGPGDLKLEMILDVPVTLTVEVGRTRLSVRELLKLNRGSVVELDQLVSQPMSLLVNETLVAHGEPVMVNDRFGIRLTDVVSAEQRVRKLS